VLHKLVSVNHIDYFPHEIELQKLPFMLARMGVLELEEMLFEIIEQNFNDKDQWILFDAYESAKRAHKGQTREGSGLPYIQHPLGVAIHVWKMAELINFEGVDKKNLLLAAIYHDAIEDTEVFELKRTDEQFNEMVKRYSEDLAIIVKYVTKIPLNIDKTFKKLRNQFKVIALETFSNHRVPFISRLVKMSDRMMNLADMDYSSQGFKESSLNFTEKHFDPVLNFLPFKLKHLFYDHFISVKEKFSID
jgi:(p)ppGpp synthase/HD superfamily hydrolase